MLKILCLTSNDLNSPDFGGALRSRKIFGLLSRWGEVQVVQAGSYDVWAGTPPATLGGFPLLRRVQFEHTRPTLRNRIRRELDPHFQDFNWFQATAANQRWLREAIPQFDLIWIHGIAAADGFGLQQWPHSVLDIDDLPSSYFRSQLGQAANPLQWLRWRRQVWVRARHETTLPQRFDCVCVCSKPDRELIVKADNVFVLPNGFDAPAIEPVRQIASPPRIGFIGAFGYEPNVEGVRWFAEKVWPQILQKVPDARLRLVGSRSEKHDWRQYPNVEVLGWVADSAAEMASWTLSVVPIFVGGGTRIKIAEAFSRKCPLVSTSLGAYGYDVTDGEELLLADSPEEFARRCLAILTDPTKGPALADKGWKKFNEHWTWEKQSDRIAEIVARATGKTARP
jgi:glycosyltransferase involved in cell wall biosynthesis